MSKPCGCLDPPFKGLNCRLPKIEQAVRAMLAKAIKKREVFIYCPMPYNEASKVVAGYEAVLKLFEKE